LFLKREEGRRRKDEEGRRKRKEEESRKCGAFLFFYYNHDHRLPSTSQILGTFPRFSEDFLGT